MADRSIVQAIYNVGSKKYVDSSNIGIPNNLWPWLKLRTQCVVQLDLYNTNGTPYTALSSSMQFHVTLDTDYDRGNDPVSQSLNAVCNLTEDRADVNIEQGKLSFRFDLDTASFLSKVGSSEAIDGLLEIQVRKTITVRGNSITVPITVFTLPVYLENLVDTDGTAEEDPENPQNYYTKLELDALLEYKADKTSTDDIEFTVPEATLNLLNITGGVTTTGALSAPSGYIEVDVQ